jgi:tetratricopeptide (TPR) repeat protein
MQDIRSISVIVVALVALIVLIIYRRPLVALIFRLAKTKKITKTRNGFATEFGEEPEQMTDERQKSQKIIEERQRVEDVAKEKEDETGREDWWDYFISKEYDKAIEIIEDQISKETDKDKIVNLESVIGLCLSEKNFNDGVRKLKAVIEKYPKCTDPYFWLCWIYSKNNFYDKAILILDDGIDNVQDKTKLLKNKVICLSNLGRLDEGLVILNEILRENSNDIGAHLMMADIYVKQNKNELANSCYKKALRANPNNEKTLREYADFLYNNNEKEKALIFRKKLVALFPNNSTHWTLLGNVYLDLGLDNKSLECYEKANGIAKEKEGWILANIGNIYRNKGFYNKAIGFFKSALEVKYESDYVHDRLSAALKLKAEEGEKEQQIINKVKGRLGLSA